MDRIALAHARDELVVELTRLEQRADAVRAALDTLTAVLEAPSSQLDADHEPAPALAPTALNAPRRRRSDRDAPSPLADSRPLAG